MKTIPNNFFRDKTHTFNNRLEFNNITCDIIYAEHKDFGCKNVGVAKHMKQ